MSSGYSPDTLILRPADAETLDTLRTSGSELFYVFAPGNFAPSELFGLDELHLEDGGRPDRHGRVRLREAVRLAALPADVRAGRRPDEQEPCPHRAQRAGRRRAPGGGGQDRGDSSWPRRRAKSTFIVRTDAVVASSETAFYGEKVKLSDEEAKPLLKEGKVSRE